MLFGQEQNRRLKVTEPLYGAALFTFNKPLCCKKAVQQFGHGLHPLAQRLSQQNVIRECAAIITLGRAAYCNRLVNPETLEKHPILVAQRLRGKGAGLDQ